MLPLPALARPRMSLRALVALAPLALLALPGPSAAVNIGENVTAGDKTPAAVKAALTAHKTIVAAFVIPGVADDDAVLAALVEARRSEPSLRKASVFIYRVLPTGAPAFGDLADVLSVQTTPSVVVIAPNGKLINRFSGYVDGAILRQSLVIAARTRDGLPKETPAPKPKPGGTTTPKPTPTPTPTPKPKPAPDPTSPEGATGDAKGIALVRRVNKAMDAAPGFRMVLSGSIPGTGKVRAQVTTRGHDLHMIMQSRERRAELVEIAGTTWDRDLAVGCWRAGKTDTDANDDFIDLRKAKVWKPRRIDARVTVLRASVRDADDGTTSLADYRIDNETHRVLTMRLLRDSKFQKGATATIRALAKAPPLPVPSAKPCVGGGTAAPAAAQGA